MSTLRPQLSALRGIEQPLVLDDSVAVGHARDVVGDGACAAGLAGIGLHVLRRLVMLVRQQLGRAKKESNSERITVCALLVMRSTR